MYGWLAAGNLNIQCLGDYIDMGECKQFNHLLNKFPKDQVFLKEDDRITFLDGYIYNKNIFKNMYGKENWQEAFYKGMIEDTEKCLEKLRGAFGGYIYNKQSGELIAYTDHTGIKAVYYFTNGKKWIVSNNIEYMVTVLKKNEIPVEFDEVAAKFMLTYGYMLDSTTFIKEIRRLLPGQYLNANNGIAEIKRFYLIDNKETAMTEEEAVERIDEAFRNAVYREFEKDVEYGYRHLVDLSGGLDSRMVSWVAHDMGYIDQVNITYCQLGYYDEKISKEIAKYLRHEYLFKALDDAKWMYDIDNIISQNNGAALYMGITGGSRMLNTLQTEQFGIEHTGMIGDAILSTFYHDKAFNYSKPHFGQHRYSERLKYEFNDDILKEYSCQEMFAIYTRGILGAQTSYLIRQHYLETSSPFMDVDFLNTIFSIPFEYRNHHHIYLKWMLEKYPESTGFGWEKWGGVKPLESHIPFRKVKTTQRLLWQFFCKVFRIETRDSMIPVDYWYYHDKNIQKFYESYYQNVSKDLITNEILRKDIEIMFYEGTVTEKSMALTVLSIIKKYFS